MKDLKKILLVLTALSLSVLMVVILFMPQISFYGLRNELRETFGLDYIGKDKLCALFLDNKPVFEKASSILSQLNIEDKEFELFGVNSYPMFNINEEYTIEKQFCLISTVSVKKLKSGMVLKNINKTEIDKNITKSINDSDIDKVLSDFDFERIDIGNNYVFFVNKHAGFIAGILYTPLDVPESAYGCDIEMLAENWYCCYID